MSIDVLSVGAQDATCPLCNKIFEDDQPIRVILGTTIHIVMDEMVGGMAPGANLDWHSEEWIHEDCYRKMIDLLPSVLKELME